MSFDLSPAMSCHSSSDLLSFCISPGDLDSSEVNRCEPGDILQLFSNALCVIHYGVYLGKGLVAHLTTGGMCECKKSKEKADGNEARCEKCGKPNCGKGQVQIQNIADMIKKEAYQKVMKDGRHGQNIERLSPDEIFQRAWSMVGSVNYRVLTLNCEHFATWCAYDKPRSFQSQCLWKSGEEFREELTKDVPSPEEFWMQVSKEGQEQNPEPAADHSEEPNEMPHGEWLEISVKLE